MALFCDGPGAVPLSAILPADVQHIPDAVFQVASLFDHRAPGGPYGGRIGQGEHIAEGLHVFSVEQGIANLFHGIRVCGPLGVDVEHEKAVVTVAQGDALDGLQGVVQVVRLGGGGVDADADQRLLPAGA